jgi:prohibitin 2
MKIKTNYGFFIIPTWPLLVVPLGVFALIMLLKSYYIVNPGETGIHLRMGSMIDQHEVSGAYFKIPFFDEVITINNRIIKSQIETQALSHDLQFVSIGVAINYKIENALELYKLIGTQMEENIIDPFSQESIKAIVAQYTAEGLIQNRHEAKERVERDLRQRLEPFHITLVDFNFVHLDFHRDFLTAVENKQIAMQSAMTAKNLTEKIKEEAIQAKTQADAEAYAMKVKRESVNKETIILKIIEKWDGVLPVTMTGNALPFLDIAK